MLPPGHIAAGYLTARVLLHFTHPVLSAGQRTQLLWVGIFFGFAPDLDVFYAFGRSKSFKMDPKVADHRKYFSHAPVLWLALGLLVYIVSASPFWKTFGLLIWLGSWSHFILDSIQYGIMWFWPLNKKVYCLYKVIDKPRLDIKMSQAADKQGFIKYWVTFIKEYSHGLKISLICEIILLIFTIFIYLK